MRKSCKAPVTVAALSALLLSALLAVAGPAGAADKTTTTTKSKASDKDSAKSDKDDESKSGKTTTTTKGDEDDTKGSTTTTTKAGTKAGVTLTAYGVAVSGGPELSARPPVRLSSCPASDTGSLSSVESAGAVKTGAISVVSGCTDSAGTKTVKSRADVNAVEIGTGAKALTAGTIASACVANADGNQGGVVITDLKVGGKAIAVTDVAPNTALSKLAKGLTGVVNEQVTTGDKLAVNGLRITQGTADIVLGHVECSLSLTAAVGGPPVVGPTTTKAKPVATTTGGSKSKKDLANTGRGMSPSLILALGALFVGILMRIGADGLLVLVPGGRERQRRRQSTATLRRSPAHSWSPREPEADTSERQDP